MLCLLPSVPAKEDGRFPVLRLEGCHLMTAGLVQRKSVIDLAVRHLAGMEPKQISNSIPLNP